MDTLPRTPDADVLTEARSVPALTGPLTNLTAAYRRWDDVSAVVCLHQLEVALCRQPTVGSDATRTAAACARAIRAELAREGA